MLSGTLAFIFNELKKGEEPFSEIVKKAKALGYTEPDPRDDLSATDFARKLVCVLHLRTTFFVTNSLAVFFFAWVDKDDASAD